MPILQIQQRLSISAAIIRAGATDPKLDEFGNRHFQPLLISEFPRSAIRNLEKLGRAIRSVINQFPEKHQ